MRIDVDPLRSALVQELFATKAIIIHDVDAGEEPFTYTSGHIGPGYVEIKGIVSQRKLLKALIYDLARRAIARFPDVEYVAGNATGGIAPGWVMAEALSDLKGCEVPYIYVRETPKTVGLPWQIIGDRQNPFFRIGRRGLVFDELVNYAQTTVNSALIQRKKGYNVHHAATILFYGHHAAHQNLAKANMDIVFWITLRELLAIALESGYPKPHLIKSWLSFLNDPRKWQQERGLLKTEEKQQ